MCPKKPVPAVVFFTALVFCVTSAIAQDLAPSSNLATLLANGPSNAKLVQRVFNVAELLIPIPEVDEEGFDHNKRTTDYRCHTRSTAWQATQATD